MDNAVRRMLFAYGNAVINNLAAPTFRSIVFIVRRYFLASRLHVCIHFLRYDWRSDLKTGNSE